MFISSISGSNALLFCFSSTDKSTFNEFAGIIVNIAANASKKCDGADETPYWRTVKKDGELCEKYPYGIDGHKMFLEMEGHTVVKKGKRYFVKDYEEKLFNWEL